MRLIIILLTLSSFSAFAQVDKTDSLIYRTSLDYYFENYHYDSTKSILLIDSSKSIQLRKLNMKVELTRKYKSEGNYCRYYHDYLDVDTLGFNTIKTLNKEFYLRSLDVVNLKAYFDKNDSIGFVKQSYIDTVFHPFTSIVSFSVVNAAEILDSCWSKLLREKLCLGYCAFSRPFIINQDKALIYFSFMHGSTAGMSVILLLEQESADWVVRKEIILGIS